MFLVLNDDDGIRLTSICAVNCIGFSMHARRASTSDVREDASPFYSFSYFSSFPFNQTTYTRVMH